MVALLTYKNPPVTFPFMFCFLCFQMSELSHWLQCSPFSKFQSTSVKTLAIGHLSYIRELFMSRDGIFRVCWPVSWSDSKTSSYHLFIQASLLLLLCQSAVFLAIVSELKKLEVKNTARIKPWKWNGESHIKLRSSQNMRKRAIKVHQPTGLQSENFS